jgi:hypothetical protein
MDLDYRLPGPELDTGTSEKLRSEAEVIKSEEFGAV